MNTEQYRGPVAESTRKERERWLENIADVKKFGVPKWLKDRLELMERAIEQSIHYGGTKRLHARIVELEEHQFTLEQDAARWRHARRILPYEAIQDAQRDFEGWDGNPSEEENLRCDEAIDIAIRRTP